MADGTIGTMATRKTTAQRQAERAAEERLRAMTVVGPIDLPEDKADELDAQLREAVALADRIVREANASWEGGKLSPWLASTLENVTRQDVTTRLVVRFLGALQQASASRWIVDGPGHVAFVLGLYDAPSGKRAATKAGQQAIREALAEWPKARGARTFEIVSGERRPKHKWDAIAEAVRVVLRRRVGSAALKKQWERLGPKRVA